MSKKNIFLLAAWYIAWWLIASVYNKKKPNELKKEIEKAKESWEWSFKVIVDSFIETHSNLIEDLKKDLMSEKNIKIFNEHKDMILKIMDSYKEKWNILIEELKTKWKEYVFTTSEKLEKLYTDKIKEIEELKWVAPEKLSELKDKLLVTFQELKKEIKKIK